MTRYLLAMVYFQRTFAAVGHVRTCFSINKDY